MWLDDLKDSRLRGAVAERIKRLSFGLRPDCRVARRRFQAHPEERYPKGESIGRNAEK
jgi:hypothetical protein